MVVVELHASLTRLDCGVHKAGSHAAEDKRGQLSLQIPGQFSVQINTVVLRLIASAAKGEAG